MFAALKTRPDIIGLVWFNRNKETDWRIESSPGAQAAFGESVADARYADHASP